MRMGMVFLVEVALSGKFRNQLSVSPFPALDRLYHKSTYLRFPDLNGVGVNCCTYNADLWFDQKIALREYDFPSAY